ncbi:DEAD/DEAH box helicase [Prevotella sp. DNF00663]|uniref:DEAD/DEAH box helicase n=1 Tax=Prevotella sp. DNF00663 TaxID=1384078 RepID=UPI0007850E8A|nr:DEAD/DEAH box helicase [Prevotella sp. DNF00663]KXB83109.1 DEAD/DEAH box helicase [Prevotella sp. DNF00663]
MNFDELKLNENVLDALYDMHFDTCTPVQENCIPEILKGNDVLGVAQTGTGKTAAYLLPILSKLDDGGYPSDAINCIIMSPTRELAQQIDQAMQGFGYYLQSVSSVAVYGGNDGNRYDQELKSLRLGADVVIATPGRLISHISLGNVDLSKVSFFVLDEADRMLDMGFSEDIMTIAKGLPKTCQTIMFSATMPTKIEELAKTLLKNPTEIKLAVSKPAEKIKQSAYICHETQKLGIIKSIFKSGDLKRVIIFCGSKMKVKQVNGALQDKHINSGEMHSDLDQAERDDIMFKFKSGQLDVLVATDIVSRGIDIDDIAMVINYDVPHDAEDYVHRIGRTARADRDGQAITLVNDMDISYFQQIEKFLEKEIVKNELPKELGNGPEYKADYQNRRQGDKAKNRRRKDREVTAHKRKPSRKTNDTTPNVEQAEKRSHHPKRNRNRRDNNNPTPQSAPKQGQGDAASQSKEYRSKKDRPNKARRNDSGSEFKEHKKNYRQNKKQRPQKKQVTAQQPVKQEGGLKKFFKRIFGIKK